MTCGSAAGALRVLDARTASRARLTRADAHGAADVNALSWNRSVAYLVATAGDDGCARVWDLRRFGAACEPVGRFDLCGNQPVRRVHPIILQQVLSRR